MTKNHHIEICDKPIDVNQAIHFVSADNHGANCIFTGIVRDHNHGKKVLAVEYEVYQTLAINSLNTVIKEVTDKLGDIFKFYITHRYGKLSVGEASMIVAIGSAHRHEAYQASRYIVEAIKYRCPIWKKEYYQDGDAIWLGACEHPSVEVAL